MRPPPPPPAALPRAVRAAIALLGVAAVPTSRLAAQAAATVPPSAASAPSAVRVPVRGTVYDSLGRGPLAGATVQAVRADNPASARSAVTDSTGAFQIDSLAPGRYLLGFLHPTLDLLSIQVAPIVVIADGRPLPPVVLALPGSSAVRGALCPPTPPNDSSGAVAGLVRDAATGDPVAGATVVLSWEEVGVSARGLNREVRRVPTTVRADGGFLVCGVPTDVPLAASASTPNATSGLIELSAPVRGLLLQRFSLGPAAVGAAAAPTDSADARLAGPVRPAAGTARVAGRVLGPDQQPLARAAVRVWGTAGRAQTSADGRFAIDSLPAGTFTVEVVAIGLQPSRTAVDLENGRTAEVAPTLIRQAAQLERVAVIGTGAPRSGLLDDFERRRRTGQGQYFTRAEIAKSGTTALTDVLRTKSLSSLRIIPTGARGNVLRGRAGCLPQVWLDGNVIRGGANDIDTIVSAQAVDAIEVYGSGAIIPAQYNLTGSGGSLSGGPVSCGAVLIWTVR